MGNQQVKSALLLVLTAVIWGIAFVAQSAGMDYVGPFTFNALRSIIGGIVLLPFLFFMNKQKKKGGDPEMFKDTAASRKVLITGGICCGICLCIAGNLQQIGISHTTVGKAGFITAMYIVLVPVLGIFLKKRPGILVWISVLLAMGGLYLLCLTETFALGKGDTYVLICALFFAVHILVIDHFSPLTDGIKMSCIQFFVSGILSGVLMLIFEKPDLSSILAAWLPILYAGAFSSGVGYTLQIIGQKGMDPTVASLILSLESVVSVLAGWILLNQKLSSRELMGCVLMFGAIILAQLPKPAGKKGEAQSCRPE